MTAEDFKNRAIKYLPSFVVENDLLDALLSAQGKSWETLSGEIENLADCYWTGRGLELTAEENRIFYKDTPDWILDENMDRIVCEDGSGIFTKRFEDADIQSLLEQRFNILQARGTEPGVVNDIRRIYNEPDLQVTFHDKDDAGIITGETWFGKSTTFLCDKIIQIHISEIAQSSDKILTENGEGLFIYNVENYWAGQGLPISAELRSTKRDSILEKFIKPIGAEIIYEV